MKYEKNKTKWFVCELSQSRCGDKVTGLIGEVWKDFEKGPIALSITKHTYFIRSYLSRNRRSPW